MKRQNNNSGYLANMAIKLQQHEGIATKFLKLIHQSYPEQCEFYYFMLCGRCCIGETPHRILLNEALLSESQKINEKLIWDHTGHIARRHWTIVVSFTEKKWEMFQRTTCEKEVVFECLFKNTGRYSKFAPIFQFPTINSKKTKYHISSTEFRGESMFGFRQGAIKINKKEDGRIVMLIRLEELGFY